MTLGRILSLNKSASNSSSSNLIEFKGAANNTSSVESSQSFFEKHVICQICGRLCSSKSSLMTHIRVHTGEKPFCCELCGKKFTQKATLQRHRHLHTGEKHFKCDHCSKRFYRKDKLYEHLNVHRYAMA